MEIGKTRKIFRKKPGLCWDNYFSSDNIFDHAGKNGYGMMSTVRRDHLSKGAPTQYMHKMGTEPRNLVFKCSRLNEPIIMVQNKKNKENNSTYDLRSTINVQVFFSDFTGNLRARKPNKAQTKRANITGVQYFHAYHQVVSTSSFIIYHLSSLYFLTICANLPFCLRLRDHRSTPSPTLFQPGRE